VSEQHDEEETLGELIPLPARDVLPADDEDLPTITVTGVRPLIAPRHTWRPWLRDRGFDLLWRGYSVLFWALRGWRYFGHSHRGLATVVLAWRAWLRNEVDALMLARLATSVIDSPAAAGSTYNNLAPRHDRIRRWRRGITLAAVLLFALAGLLLWRRTGWLGTVPAAALVLVLLGVIGDRDRTAVGSPAPLANVLTGDELVAAFVDAKIEKMKPEDPPVVYGIPHAVDNGFEAQVELPGGVTFRAVMKAHESLAGRLHVPTTHLVLDPLPDIDASVIGVFVARDDPQKLPLPVWPLLEAGTNDVFRPAPMAWDMRLRPVLLPLIYGHILVAGLMRRGKTTTLRAIALAILNDVRALLAVFDFAGRGDWEPFRDFTARPIESDGATAAHRLYEHLCWLEAERERRKAVLRTVNPSQIHPKIARKVRPYFTLLDEVHVALTDRTPITVPGRRQPVALGVLIEEKLARIMQLGPGEGLYVVLATQKPDEDTLPPAIRELCHVRVAHKLNTYYASNAVLGSTAKRLGYDAAELDGSPGLALIFASATEISEPVMVKARFPNIGKDLAEAILDRLAERRLTLEPAPADDPAPAHPGPALPPVPGIVARALDMWPGDQAAIHLDQLAGLLATTARPLAADLRAAKVPVEQVNVKRDGEWVNRSGVYLAKLKAVATR